jgi:NAD(P)-dependent dehydrogenase (short-subunit alcohol dehydrogenase family)
MQKLDSAGWVFRLLLEAGTEGSTTLHLRRQNDPTPFALSFADICGSGAFTVSNGGISEVVDANVKGVFHVIRSFVPAMVSRRRGIIVNFSSGWGRSTSPEVAPYCATKWAIEGLTRALAEELPSGMAAVPLNPGIIDTDMLRICFGADAKAYPDPHSWAQRAVPFVLGLTARDNGHPLSVHG